MWQWQEKLVHCTVNNEQTLQDTTVSQCLAVAAIFTFPQKLHNFCHSLLLPFFNLTTYKIMQLSIIIKAQKTNNPAQKVLHNNQRVCEFARF